MPATLSVLALTDSSKYIVSTEVFMLKSKLSSRGEVVSSVKFVTCRDIALGSVWIGLPNTSLMAPN